MDYQNHVVDPNFFNDAIEMFAFDYRIYIVGRDGVDEYGNQKLTYSQEMIRGSLQSKGKQIVRSKEGNTNEWNYSFYCRSIYRIDEGDIIEYKGNYFIVTGISDYDEYGVRSASLSMIKLSAHRDFADYLKYLNGDKII